MRPAHLTPSSFSKIMSKSRTKSEHFSQTALSYADEIVVRYLGVELPEINTYEINWGLDNEVAAKETYQLKTGTIIREGYRKNHKKYDYISGHPDGFTYVNGLIEIKCPNSINHLKNIQDGYQVSDYYWQMMGYMWIFEKEWCDFISYDPRFPIDHCISINRVHMNVDDIDLLEKRCVLFWNEIVLPKIEQLKQKSRNL